MCDDEHLSTRTDLRQVGERGREAVNDRLVGFEVRGTLVPLEKSGVRRFDLFHGQTLPFAHISLTKSWVRWKKFDPEAMADDVGRRACPLEVAACENVERAEFLDRGMSLSATQIRERRVGLALPTSLCIPLAFSMSDDEKVRRGGCRRHELKGIATSTLDLWRGCDCSPQHVRPQEPLQTLLLVTQSVMCSKQRWRNTALISASC